MVQPVNSFCANFTNSAVTPHTNLLQQVSVYQTVNSFTGVYQTVNSVISTYPCEGWTPSNMHQVNADSQSDNQMQRDQGPGEIGHELRVGRDAAQARQADLPSQRFVDGSHIHATAAA